MYLFLLQDSGRGDYREEMILNITVFITKFWGRGI
jgi:hypothetical protein